MLTEIKIISLAIVLLPLLAAIIVGLFQSTVNRKWAHRLTITAVGISFFLSCWLLKITILDLKQSLNIPLYSWGSSGGVNFEIGFLIDRLSAVMITIVSLVSWMVHIYTVGYMHYDPGYQRFFSYISLFTFGMLTLVLSDNFLLLFFGWEFVGLMSYLLIGFWFKRESAIHASLKAFIVNRVGDFGFILAIAAIFYYFGTLEYSNVFAHSQKVANAGAKVYMFGQIGFSPITAICLLLLMGAMGKSAQIPLHVWLPDSMEGPTPISALIHAATMVTAGVFMIARMSPLFEQTEVALNVVMCVGAMTCLLTGLIAIVQNDIKRIIAYSTISQLGYMMTAMGASAYAVGIFHLTTHAFFKALLFLGAGSVIIALHHEQNIWKMGGLRKAMPITYITMLIGTLAIIGFPFFSGFYSKDLIIEAVRNSDLWSSPFAYWILVGGVFITALYSFRLLFVVFHGPSHHLEAHKDPHAEAVTESPSVILIPLIILAVFSVIAGMIFVTPILKGFFSQSLVTHSNHPAMAELQKGFTDFITMGLHGFLSVPVWFAILGAGVAWFSYIYKPAFANQIKTQSGMLYNALINKLGFDTFYENTISPALIKLGSVFSQIGDKLLIDGFLVNGSARGINRMAWLFRGLQTGYLYHYAFTMITGFLLLIIWLVVF